MTDDDDTTDECGPGASDGQAMSTPPETEPDGEERERADREVTEIPLGVPVSDDERRAMKEAALRHHDDGPAE